VDEPDPEGREGASNLVPAVVVPVPVADEQADGEIDDQRKRTSVSAWPSPHQTPSAAARRRACSRPEAIRVVTAARWSGSVACRRPSRVATSRTIRIEPPCEKVAMWSSSPNS
jgi:hypothetical protein